MISERVKNFIKEYSLKEPFIVAFSGGYDSMCLADILVNIGYFPITIHLNHNWRGNESKQEEENCRSFAKERGLVFYSETLPDSIEHTETAARDARYDFFKRCAKKYNSNVVFTAHNFDDNAETILYRITKGTGIIGLQGIGKCRDNLFYRPLLSTQRSEIEQYCKENNLKPNNDSSNNDSRYKRNYIRNEILPLLKNVNPKVSKALNSLAEIATEDFEFLKKSDKYFVRELLVSNGLDYDRKKILEIEEFIKKNKTSKSGKIWSLTSDLWLFVSDKEIKVISKSQKPEQIVNVKKEGIYKFGKYEFVIKNVSQNISEYPKDSENRAYINADMVNFVLRYRRDGDIISPLGCKGSQKLKKYLNEKKIPNYRKDELVLLCDEKEVLWVAGVGISDKIKVDDKPTHYIELRKSYE